MLLEATGIGESCTSRATAIVCAWREGRRRNAWGECASSLPVATKRTTESTASGTRSTTYRTKRDADIFLAATRTDIERGTWVDPNAGKVTLDEYSKGGSPSAPTSARTRELYERLLRRTSSPRLASRS